jgi:signal transduction histidine kinase
LLDSFGAVSCANLIRMRKPSQHIQPLREAMLRRILPLFSVVLILHFFVVVRIGMPPTLKNVAGTAIWPWMCLAATAIVLRWGGAGWRFVAATPMLFQAIVFSAAVPQAVLARQGGYAYYGGMILLTILLSGLLLGEFYVAAWTFVCCVSFQFAISEASGWVVNAAWSAVYIAAAWLVIQFSRHLERLHEQNRLAEEQKRSAIVAERTRFARDIHDSLAQGFIGIVEELNAAEEELTKQRQAVRMHVENARQLASKNLGEARRSVSTLLHTQSEAE